MEGDSKGFGGWWETRDSSERRLHRHVHSLGVKLMAMTGNTLSQLHKGTVVRACCHPPPQGHRGAQGQQPWEKPHYMCNSSGWARDHSKLLDWVKREDAILEGSWECESYTQTPQVSPSTTVPVSTAERNT